MEKKKAYKLKADATSLSPTVQVGKNGITKTIIEELRRQLKKMHLVKVKFPKSAIRSERAELAQQLARSANAELIETRGMTAVYFKGK
ncbi:MAG: YhbY family RNA-binding protein [Methanosarcinales archaeon]|nr:MAG: YhbY family RNA-binding protein [Methanosarcinales archaeon]